MKSWRMLGLVLVVISALVLLAAACGDDDEEDEGDGAPTATEANGGSPAGGAGELELIAQDTKFDRDELTAEAGADVKISFQNKDNAVQHNFSLYETEESEDPLFEGDITTGPETTTYEFTAPADSGTYHFHCDIHPTAMQGDFVVE